MSTRQPTVNTELEPSPQTHIRKTASDKPLRQTDSTYNTIIIYTDGSYHNQRNLAGIGFVLQTRGGEEIYCGSEETNVGTSMEAEGKAMLRAVTIAREFDPQHIIVHTDCTPLQRKLLEESSPSKPLYQTIRSEINDFEHSTVRDIPRKRNETADDLASLALRRAKDNEIAS